MQSLLKELKAKIESEHRSSAEIYMGLKQAGTQLIWQMSVTRTLSRDIVIAFCAGLIKLYLQLTEEQNVQS